MKKSARVIAACLVLVTSSVAASIANAQATAPAGDAASGPASRMERFCSNDGGKRAADWGERSLDRITERLKLTDAQKALYKDFQDTREKARGDGKTALCANKPDMATFSGRLGFRQGMAEQRLAVIKATNPKLLAFYNALDADQKTKFDAMGEAMRERHRQRHQKN